MSVGFVAPLRHVVVRGGPSTNYMGKQHMDTTFTTFAGISIVGYGCSSLLQSCKLGLLVHPLVYAMGKRQTFPASLNT